MGKLIYVPGEDQAPFGSQVVTLDDLEKFRVTLMMDFKKMMEGNLAKPLKRWLKSHEVKKMLQISYSTLQMLRNTGKIPYTRIGGLIYYDAAEIERILETEKKVT
jgi:Helix-turn-helix domain